MASKLPVVQLPLLWFFISITWAVDFEFVPATTIESESNKMVMVRLSHKDQLHKAKRLHQGKLHTRV